jgi:hypothetical protein
MLAYMTPKKKKPKRIQEIDRDRLPHTQLQDSGKEKAKENKGK